MSFGKNSGGGGFARAPGPGEEVGVGDAVLLDGRFQDFGRGFLAHKVGKFLGPVLSRQNKVGHGFLDMKVYLRSMNAARLI